MRFLLVQKQKLTKIKMHNLQINDITTLYVVIDDCIPARGKSTGRPPALSDSEMMTILLWCTFLLKQKNLKDIYRFIKCYHLKDFPHIPAYANFVAHCHRLIPLMGELHKNSLAIDAELRFADSTMIEVCKHVRANSHKVARGIADFNHCRVRKTKFGINND